jgi:hypothetical protein
MTIAEVLAWSPGPKGLGGDALSPSLKTSHLLKLASSLCKFKSLNESVQVTIKSLVPVDQDVRPAEHGNRQKRR